MINYDPFYKTLSKKKITQYQLINDYFIPSGTIHRIRNNQNVSLSTIDSLCKVLKCKITDIVIIT